VLPCDGIHTAAQPFLAALLHRRFPARPLVIVTEGLKSQESVHQDLATWFSSAATLHAPRSPGSSAPSADGSAPATAPSPLFYPAWESLPHESRLPHADVISERLETLIALGQYRAEEGRPAPVLVASVASLLQRTFAHGSLQGKTRTFNRGDRIDPLDLIEWLEEQGYEPEAQVTQKGELALRGGILDIYPLTSPWPVRLEFFGDELESLRYFDPLTQISREEVLSVTVPPAGEVGVLKCGMRKSGTDTAEGSPVKDAAAGGNKESAEGRLGSLLDYLPRETILVLLDPEQLALRADEYATQIPENDPFYIAWDTLQTLAREKGLTLLELNPADWGGDGSSPVDTTQGEPISLTSDPFLIPHSALRTPHSPDSDPSEPVQTPLSGIPHSALHTPHFQSLDAFRPLADRAPDPQVAEAQRQEFFSQLHRWSRQGYAVHLFCNNDGERQRFCEIWGDYGLATQPAVPALPSGSGGLWIHLGTLARGFISDDARLVVVTDAEIFGRYKVQRPRRLKSPHAQATRSALDIDFTDLEEGDYVVHLQHGIGRYVGLRVLPIGAGTKGMQPQPVTPEATGQECLVIEYAATEPGQPEPRLYVPVTEAHLVSKYVGTGKARPPLNTLGGTRWAKTKAQAERAVRDVASDLLSIQAARESQEGHPFPPDSGWQREFEGSFLYEETPDQMRAINDAKADMERPKPMDRLVCGDVGFGKTEVGIRAAFKAVMGGKQVAVLVPTTVLAQQHYNTFRDRMADYPIRVELLSRFRTRREQQKVVKDLAAGSVDIVIGTHRLLQGDIVFKDLGLVVIDEEQRFGVLHKEKFKMLRKLVDVLTLSATPIPRTLYLALTGARDMSTIQTPPHDRLPVETVVTQYDERVIRDAVQRELNRGGQVFFLHNRVMTILTMAQKLAALAPKARIVVGHGQMDPDDLEKVMTQFINGEADILLSTTIIESGLDIPNANTIIIDRADRFGLSDLYQLRGRVGRYKHQAYAYLLLPRHGSLLTDARKRMSAIKQYSTLGSGFKIAMRDLEIRGAGNLLGSEQSGHITAVGFELYCQLLKQSVAVLKGEKVKPRVEVQVRFDFLALNPAETGPTASGETAAAAYIPFNYVSDTRQRIEIYRKLAQADRKEAIESLTRELRDRFGPLPPALELLLLVGELKILAAEKNIPLIEVKEEKLMLTRNNDYIMVGSKFPRLIKKQPAARLKEIKKLLLAL
jgi:transcription-repair coupling factor (superfamily II helicase)